MHGQTGLGRWAGGLKRRAYAALGRKQVQRLQTPLRETPDIDSERFLFLGGLHRSGTSILHRLLCEHPQTSGFRNTGVPEDEGQFLQSAFPPARTFGGPGRFAFDPAASLEHLIDGWSDAQTGQVLREWGAYYDLGKPILLEKSPPNLIRCRFLRRLFPGSSFVFVLRHPAAVALATRKWSRSTVVEMVLHWHAAHQALVRQEPREKVLIIRYEDFVSAPSRALEQIYSLAGIGSHVPNEAVEDRNGEYFAQWARSYMPDVELLSRTFPGVVDALSFAGYSLTPPFVIDHFDQDQFLRQHHEAIEARR